MYRYVIRNKDGLFYMQIDDSKGYWVNNIYEATRYRTHIAVNEMVSKIEQAIKQDCYIIRIK